MKIGICKNNILKKKYYYYKQIFKELLTSIKIIYELNIYEYKKNNIKKFFKIKRIKSM